MVRALPIRQQVLRSDIGLRATGLVLALLSVAAVRALVELHRQTSHPRGTALLFVLAAGAFLAASAGGILISLGRHVFDEILVSSRWAAARLRPDAAQEQG